MRVGVISDTHGLLRPEALVALAGVAHLIHAGDIGKPGIVEALAGIAPVTAIRGNVDIADWALAYPEETTVALAGHRVLVLHDLKRIRVRPAEAGIDIVVSGHTHRPLVERAGDVLFLNPGSAGPRRFRLPVTLALLDLDASGARAEIIDLAT